MTDKLNSLDLEVKKMMLSYPSIFPSRLECLHHLFCVNGTGYYWKDGILVNDLDDDVMPEHIKSYEKKDESDKYFGEYYKVKNEFETTKRELTEKHIDYLCSDIHHTGVNMKFISVYPMSWNYCAMGYAADNPYDIDVHWRRGIKEFCHWFFPEFRGHYGFLDKYENEDSLDFDCDPRAKRNFITMNIVMRKMYIDEEKINAFKFRRSLRKRKI